MSRRSRSHVTCTVARHPRPSTRRSGDVADATIVRHGGECNPVCASRPPAVLMATSDTLPRHVLHDRLTRPEAQLTARRNEFGTSLRSIQRDAPVIAVVRHARLLEERQRCFYIADELAMREGIGDEIARGRLLHQDLDTVFRWQERHRIIEYRWAAAQLLGRFDPRTVACLDPTNLWRDDLKERSFLFQGRSDRLQDGAIHTIGDECPDLASFETGRAIQLNTQGRRLLQMLLRGPRGVCRPGHLLEA